MPKSKQHQALTKIVCRLESEGTTLRTFSAFARQYPVVACRTIQENPNYADLKLRIRTLLSAPPRAKPITDNDIPLMRKKVIEAIARLESEGGIVSVAQIAREAGIFKKRLYTPKFADLVGLYKFERANPRPKKENTEFHPIVYSSMLSGAALRRHNERKIREYVEKRQRAS